MLLSRIHRGFSVTGFGVTFEHRGRVGQKPTGLQTDLSGSHHTTV